MVLAAPGLPCSTCCLQACKHCYLLIADYGLVGSNRHDFTSCKYFHEHANDHRRNPLKEVETCNLWNTLSSEHLLIRASCHLSKAQALLTRGNRTNKTVLLARRCREQSRRNVPSHEFPHQVMCVQILQIQDCREKSVRVRIRT